ncbi:MAG: tetratricopeptide repeat protein [Longilinea sp.]|nr:tetratricopeptide repeat protein [Longilinea sp.]MCA1954774.1 tetratricopeptide repeat protein [Anaerolinea sp.]
MSAEEKMFQEALTAIQNNEPARARDLFTRLLRMNQYDARYWLWMSSVVETTKERIYCLKQTLELDPNNADAKRGLILLGVLPPDDTLSAPYHAQVRKWNVPLGEQAPKLTARSARQIGIVVGAIVLLVAMLALAVTGIISITRRPAATKAAVRPVITIFASPSPTPDAGRPVRTPTPAGPTPPWQGLPTFTPSPIPMLTPYVRFEAYSIGMRAFQRQEWDKAITNLNQVIAQNPQAADLHYLIGEIYRYQGQTTEALAAYNKAIAADPSYGPSYLGRARVQLMRDPTKIREARADLEKAIQFAPDLGEAYLELAILKAQSNEQKAALEDLQTASNYLPDSPLLALTRSEILLYQGDYEAALQEANAALAIDPSLLEAYYIQGIVYSALEQPTQAILPLYLYTTYATAPDNDSWMLLARAYLSDGQSDRALVALDKAAQLKPSYDVYFLRGEVYMQQQKYDLALKNYGWASDWNPRSFEASMGQARAYFAMGEYGNAYEQYSDSRALAKDDSERAQFFYERALSAEKLNRPDAAIYDWINLLQLPEDAMSPEMRAEAQEHLSRLHTSTWTPRPSLTPTLTVTPRLTATPTPTPTRTRRPVNP